MSRAVRDRNHGCGRYAGFRFLFRFVVLLAAFPVILCIRTWAVWNQDRRVGYGLFFMLLGTFIAECFWLSEITKIGLFYGALLVHLISLLRLTRLN